MKNTVSQWYGTTCGKIQHSPLLACVMILLVFGASVFLLLLPSQSDLPTLYANSKSPQNIEAECAFTVTDTKAANQYRNSFGIEFPKYYRLDKERYDAIMNGYRRLIAEVLRRSASEETKTPYNTPPNADQNTAELVSLVREMTPQLFSYLRVLAMDEDRRGKAERQVDEIVMSGIVTETELNRSQLFTSDAKLEDKTLNSQMNAKILDLEKREVGPIKVERLPTPQTAADQTVDSLFGSVSPSQRLTYDKTLNDFFKALYAGGNLTYDEALTMEKFETAFNAEPEAKRNPEIRFAKDTILIKKNELVTADKLEIFKAYAKAYSDNKQNSYSAANLFRKVTLVALLIVFSCLYLSRIHPELVQNNRSVWLIGLIVIFSLVCDRVCLEGYNNLAQAGGYPYVPLYLAMPLALPALVIAVIYSGRAAIFASLFVAGVSAVALDNSFPAFVTGLFVCSVCAFTVRSIFDYKKFFTAAFFSCTITMMMSSVIFRQNPDFPAIVHDSQWNILGFSLVVPLTSGLITAILGLVVIFFLESVLDVTSNMSYLSMTDRNHPLLKQLQMEAPGTYHHCERVALLAEEAAGCVGGTLLKAQAYALFHDVGKLAAPEMFTENARGSDMFKNLPPAESAAIIRKHVEYGVQLARKYKLKTPLRRAIERHHGNDFISFFYEAEKKRTGTIPPEEPFRYAGPLPAELEVVILMLADCCEAAVCSLPDPTEENVRAIVEKIFIGKLQRHQLDAADITLEQLTVIRESFLKTLKSMNHTRIAYPRAEEKAE